ncbi:hypothetical protein PG991_000060 [Apiospora marii]|uniref:Amidoligase enzyme n=1 Tax=Apiospora marii TaxID=335849 RepID=A0ABR1T113_9PEZI
MKPDLKPGEEPQKHGNMPPPPPPKQVVVSPKPRRPVMTHGKEVEFLARYVDQLVVPPGGADPDEGLLLQRQKDANPGVVVVPQAEAAELAVPDDYTRTLERNGVDVNPSQGVLAPGQERWGPAHPNAQYTALPEFHRWTVYEDSTVVISPPTEHYHQQDLPSAAPAPSDQPHSRRSDGGWYGLELISPAQPNTAAAHQETAFVLGVLRQQYGNRMRVNESCGLHIHVGMGPDAIPVHRLRRIAALLYAADPLLAVLHPAHRRHNRFCPSIRRHANVTWGMVEAMATAEVSAAGGGAGSSSSSWTERGGGGGRENTPVSLRAAVAQLLVCDTGYAVARLLQYRDAKSNYNFNSYLVARSAPPRGNVTVEFRQHEGTLDARRIEAWARLCVGVTEWAALDMTEEQLAQVVGATERVEQQQQRQEEEEVVDELRRDGLRRLLEAAGLGELVWFYGLQQQEQHHQQEQGLGFRRASL